MPERRTTRVETNRRGFLKTMGLAATALAMPSACVRRPVGSPAGGGGEPTYGPPKPNIVLFMADDMGYSDLGCYGGEIETPNIDALAAGGVRFSQFYNAARCCPTRASLLTGLYPHQAGVGKMVTTNPDARPAQGSCQGYLNDECVTIAEVLRGGGYRTYMSGKWHVGEFQPNWPTNRGFDRYFGLISGAANYFDIRKTGSPGGVRRMAMDGEPWQPPEDDFYMTDAISEHAVQFLAGHAEAVGAESGEEPPFFLYVPYTAPHWPLHALPGDIEKYRGRFREGWDVLRQERWSRLVDLGLIDRGWPLPPREEEIPRWRDVQRKDDMELKMAVYAAQIDRMDQGVGRIVEQVRRMGQLDNTLILFLSDNGGCHEGGVYGFDRRDNGLPPGGEDSYMSYGRGWAHLSNTPFRLHKHWVHEGGISTPLIAHWPSFIRERGGVNHEVGHIIDIMATCCELAGVEYPSEFNGRPVTPLEGRSLVTPFAAGVREGRPCLAWEHFGNRAVREDRWKLVSTAKGKWELYDMVEDRTELQDLSSARPEAHRRLLGLYEGWAERVGV